MKNLRIAKTVLSKQALLTPCLVAIAAMLAGAFWLASAPHAQAQTCTVCHKRTQTQNYPCSSLEYARHLDHGDPMGACATPTAKESSRKIDPVRITPLDIAVK